MSEEGYETLEIKGRKVVCPLCGSEHFWTRETLMNTRGATFFGWDWANQAATNYVCHECGYVLWFLTK